MVVKHGDRYFKFYPDGSWYECDKYGNIFIYPHNKSTSVFEVVLFFKK